MTTTKTLRKSGVTNKKSSQKQPNTIALIFKTIFKKYRTLFIFVVGGILISALASVAGTMFIKTLLTDYVNPLIGTENPDFSNVITAICYMAGIYAAGMLSALVYNQLMIIISQNTMRSIRNDMFIKMQKLPVKYFDRKNNGDIMRYLSNDTDTIMQLL